MRTSKIRAKFDAGKAARIACMYYPTAMLPNHAAHAGYDGIWLDSEHNSWDPRELQRMILLHQLADIDCIVRTGNRNPNHLYHLLENGASALMIPLVNSREEAASLVESVKFPPLGQRGLDGASVDNDFYLQGTDTYHTSANRETLLIVQIETPEAVANVKEIASVPGVDGLFLGPGDLSLRYQCPLDWEEKRMAEAQSLVADAAHKNGIAWGRPAKDLEDIRQLNAMGAQIINHGSDFGFVVRGIANSGSTLGEVLE